MTQQENIITRLAPGPKAKWLEALRSGRFKQAQGALADYVSGTDDLGHCCLGVLCEVAKAEGVIEDYDQTDGYPQPAVIAWATGLSVDAVRWSGTASDSMKDLAVPGTVLGNRTIMPDQPVTLVTLNDTHDFTFEQIADAIEEHL